MGTFREWPTNYPSSIGRFATASLWDDYLTFHYTGETFDPGHADVAVVTPAKATQTDFTEAVNESAPAADAEIVAPGAGQLDHRADHASRRARSAQTAWSRSPPRSPARTSPTSTTTSATTGKSDGSYLTADAGFIEPGTTKEIGGVYYPDWGEGGVVSVEYDWEPTLYFMSDGNEANDQFAFFNPTVYGADVEHDIYTVRGTYTFLDSGTQIDAEIDFNGDGDMQSVWGFSDADDGSAPAPGTRSPRSPETPSPSPTSTSSSTRTPTASSSTTTAAP